MLSAECHSWVEKVLGGRWDRCTLLHGGIGARRYYRLHNGIRSCVLMDAREEPESLGLFLRYASTLQASGFRVPHVFATHANQALCVVEDLGERHLLSVLDRPNSTDYYLRIGMDLLKLHQWDAHPVAAFDWLNYRKKLMRIGAYVPPPLWPEYQECMDRLLKRVSEQPQVVCHHDFHSLNIMQLTDGSFGYLDFQGLRLGPLTYDWVSLLRDCYIDWSPIQVLSWLKTYYKAYKNTTESPLPFEDIQGYFDVTGLMRHLRCYALFAKRQAVMPSSFNQACLQRLRGYIHEVCQQYPEFRLLEELL